VIYQRCRECGASAREVCRDDDDTEATEPCDGRRLLLGTAMVAAAARAAITKSSYQCRRRARLALARATSRGAP